MKKLGIAIVIIIMLVVVAYGGYRVVRHMARQQTPVMSATKTMPTPTKQAMTNTVYKTMSSPTLGNYLTDMKGMTLYTYTKDTAGVSNCNGACLTIWPAYTTPSQTSTLPANISIIKRSNGTLQYAWKGMPLYYFAKDKNPGKTTGQGVGGVWNVAK